MINPGAMVWSPVLPVPVLIGLGLVVLGLAGFAYARSALSRGLRLLLFVLRATALVLMLIILMRPQRLQSAPDPDRKSLFTVALDFSASMNTRDVGGASRWETARQALVQGESGFLWKLAQEHQLARRTFAEQVQVFHAGEELPLTNAPGLKTDLAGLLRHLALNDQPTRSAGVCILSDGRDNAGGNLAEAIGLLRARQIPVWTVCLGEQTDVRDLYVRARFSQNFLFAGQPAHLMVTLNQSGYDGFHVNVHLYREDQYVETRQAVLGQGLVQLTFPVNETAKGLYRYKVKVDSLPGEGDVRNNERVLFARVVDRKVRVLLAEARPHWDSKFLLRALQEDPHLEVTSIFYLAPNKVFSVREQTSSETLEEERKEQPIYLPRTREALYGYDCVLLGKDMDRLLNDEESRMLRDYVSERGGGLVFFRGRAYQGTHALADLEPVVWEDDILRDVHWELTAEGRASPVFVLNEDQPSDLVVRSLPAMSSITRVRGEKSLAVVLATGRTPDGVTDRQLAALAYQRYGKGKVLTVGAAGLWRWSFLPDGLDEWQGVYRRLWAQIIRWLVSDSDFLPGQDITFHTERYAYQPGERVRLTIRTRQVALDDYHPVLTVQPPEGPIQRLEPARMEDTTDFTASFVPEVEGEYRITLANNIGQPRQDEVRFTAYSDFEETRLVSTDRDGLANLARQTGGAPLTLAELDSLPERARTFAAQTASRPELADAWDTGFWLGVLTGILGLEWWLRRRGGAA